LCYLHFIIIAYGREHSRFNGYKRPKKRGNKNNKVIDSVHDRKDIIY